MFQVNKQVAPGSFSEIHRTIRSQTKHKNDYFPELQYGLLTNVIFSNNPKASSYTAKK